VKVGRSELYAGRALLIALMAYAGLRRSELLGLDWDDVDLSPRLLKVRKPKGGRQRTIPIHPGLVPLIVDYYSVRQPLVEHALFIGVGAGALYLVTGGPIWTAKLLRRRLRPTRPEQAYDALPRPMQKWVDSLVADFGPTARDARNTLSEEIANWRLAPLKNKKARRELAKAMVEGPPGPQRAGWKAAEAALMLATAAVTRRLVDQYVLGRKPEGGLNLREKAPASPKQAAKEYSGMSERGRN